MIAWTCYALVLHYRSYAMLRLLHVRYGMHAAGGWVGWGGLVAVQGGWPGGGAARAAAASHCSNLSWSFCSALKY